MYRLFPHFNVYLISAKYYHVHEHTKKNAKNIISYVLQTLILII